MTNSLKKFISRMPVSGNHLPLYNFVTTSKIDIDYRYLLTSQRLWLLSEFVIQLDGIIYLYYYAENLEQ